MQVEYYVKHVYGRPLMYVLSSTPEGFQNAHQCLTKRETLSEGDLVSYDTIGVEFLEVVAPRGAESHG